MSKIFTKGLSFNPAKGLFSKDYDLYGYATVEVQDRDRDLIRVKGFKGELHKESPVKLVGTAHKYTNLPDGTVPSVGVIGEFVPTTRKVKGQDVPAIAFGADWDRDDKGEVDPYAAKFQRKYKNGTLDSFSVGLEGYKATPIKGGGLEVQEWDIFEVSCCLIPRNPYTTVLQSLKAEFGDDLDADAMLEERIIELQKSMDRVCGLHESMLKAFNERFDTFESKYVSASDGAEPTADRRTPQPEALEALNKALEALKARF